MPRFHHVAGIVGALMVLAACGGSITGPQNMPPPATIYRATLTASSTCADKLPDAARERTYKATVYADGTIEWQGTALPFSPRMATTQGRLSGSSFAFSLDNLTNIDDDIVGIWDPLDGGGKVVISGKGTGTLQDEQIAGTLDGSFTFLTGVGFERESCEAADHRFTFVRQ